MVSEGESASVVQTWDTVFVARLSVATLRTAEGKNKGKGKKKGKKGQRTKKKKG